MQSRPRSRSRQKWCRHWLEGEHDGNRSASHHNIPVIAHLADAYGEDRSWSDPQEMTMQNEILITAIFVRAGLLAYVIIPGLLIIWDRVLNTREGTEPMKEQKGAGLDHCA
jgi:hypothetical protein